MGVDGVLFAAPAITLLRNLELFPTPKVFVWGGKTLLTVGGEKKGWAEGEASREPAA